jgi:hypothetical protein
MSSRVDMVIVSLEIVGDLMVTSEAEIVRGIMNTSETDTVRGIMSSFEDGCITFERHANNENIYA